MRVFTRHTLVHAAIGRADRELLLEGSWQAPARRPGRWSLDELIDARFAWIDRAAIECVERISQSGVGGEREANFPYINALALRYHLVKLLRVVAFFRDLCPLEPGERLELYLSESGDEPYADLLSQIARLRGAGLGLRWHDSPASELPGPNYRASWRRWAAHAARWRYPAPVPRADAPQVVLCGNPRILNPVCAELAARGCRVWWLYERFAVRCWWRWREAGVEQLTCDANATPSYRFSDAWTGNELMFDGIDLAPSIEAWLVRRAAEIGGRQSSLIERVEKHFREVRPTALVLDEDATPLKRIAAAAARRHRARSSVVQHGAPCGPFGFAPLAADEICAWGDSSRRQFAAWGIPDERIRAAGWPSVKPALLSLEPSGVAAGAGKRFLLLATAPPRDGRPDNVAFHLTTENHAAMLDMVREALSRIEVASLTIKPHPRARGQAFMSLLNDPALSVRVTNSRDLAALVAQSDCVLSCASTAGIEAALAGAPVIQLLPIGSGDVLPAEEWGFVGSARTPAELTALVTQALARGWQKNADAVQKVAVEHGRQAAARIVDGVVGTAASAYPPPTSPTASARQCVTPAN